MRALVDVGDLRELAHAVGGVQARLSEGTAVLPAALGAAPVPALALAAHTRETALEALSALRSLVALAAES